MSNKKHTHNQTTHAHEEEERRNANKVVAGIIGALAVVATLAVIAYFAVQ